MTTSQDGFTTRLRNVERRHARMAHGYASKVGPSGLIVFRPKRRKMKFPIRGIVLAVVGVLVFKGLIIAQIGVDSYAARLEALQAGSMLEQAGAAVMQPDPISRVIALKLTPLF